MTTMTTTKSNSNVIVLSPCYRGWYKTSLYFFYTIVWTILSNTHAAPTGLETW